MTKIAFIGLGNMGLPMALNLHRAGHDVTVFDTSPASVSAAWGEGMTAAQSAEEAVVAAEAVVTMLPNGTIVLGVLRRILDLLPKGSVIVDCSTIDVVSARQLHDMAATAGLLSLDAPVSGGTSGAAAGALTFMVGGSQEALEKAEPLLSVMGHKTVHCGQGGSGQAAKICNNMLLGISMIGACEAFALAAKLGLDPQAAFEVISTSSGSCWSVNKYCPVPGVGPISPADREFQPGFATELMLKDLTLSQDAARAVGQWTPLGEHALRLYNDFVEGDGAGKDFSGIIEFLRATSLEATT
jgi:3-hydroxyisobutyrate dehydrogenase